MARKEHDYHYIYKTTCSITGRYYIGMHSTSNLDDGYIGSGKRLWYSINKHGKENHSVEILEWLPDRSSLKLREKEIVNEDLLHDANCMNLKLGGEGGNTGLDGKPVGGDQFKAAHLFWNKPENIKRKGELTSARNKEKWNDLEYRSNQLSKFNFKGRSHSNETIEKLKNSNLDKQKGSLNSQYGTVWITNDTENKKMYKGDLIPAGWRLGRTIKK
ncbi:GIY-YIG_SegABCDEFG domain containing protein [uncultured Caudovirales phage]|uniref:GIY-YIG_SegABCDEFG domain containing protein n=1 Tax=uncultured Caudovirales phage TaxID=2100421 RepID=A0A6J5PUK6_9CAUD|nr:GIY-YIG_SegABCDEFG domain containing protein [uncultured Caudovirales phage]CAB4193073.1 GIY-YIG_SegABCDEFG domain containing protein [uncultured Caudovirales phage]